MKCLALFLKAAEGGGRASGRGLQMKSFLNSGIRPPCICWFGGSERGQERQETATCWSQGPGGPEKGGGSEMKNLPLFPLLALLFLCVYGSDGADLKTLESSLFNNHKCFLMASCIDCTLWAKSCAQLSVDRIHIHNSHHHKVEQGEFIMLID